MKCPCVNCICVAVCRHKHYSKLITECAILDGSIDAHIRSLELGEVVNHWPQIEKALKPTQWSIDERNNIHPKKG